MEKLRKLHNKAKFDLIMWATDQRLNQVVLDVGCGRGGDMHKWHAKHVTVHGIDPDLEAINEANARLNESGYTQIGYWKADICTWNTPLLYDIICYNFSIQYIFNTQELFQKTIDAIELNIRPGGLLIGIVPDGDKILHLPEKWSDSLGNTIERGPGRKEGYGQMILVKLTDGPYYAQGAVPEPMCFKNLLVEGLEKNGFELVAWADMIGYKTGFISDIYSRFIFRCKE